MRNQAIAKRYAKAIFEVAVEENRVDDYRQELEQVLALFREVPDFEKVLVNPIYPEDVKLSTVSRVAEITGMSPITYRFLRLLVEKQRVRFFSDIVSYYRKLQDERENIARAQVTAAVDLDEATLDLIAEALGKVVGKKVVIEFKKDPELIGGVVARVGDLVWDGSVRTQLKKIKETLKRGELG